MVGAGPVEGFRVWSRPRRSAQLVLGSETERDKRPTGCGLVFKRNQEICVSIRAWGSVEVEPARDRWTLQQEAGDAYLVEGSDDLSGLCIDRQ